MINEDILSSISTKTLDLIKFRKELHENPELGFEEVETTERILKKISECGLKGERFKNITGCFVRIGSDSEENAILLRADIDALPIQDIKNCDYRSKIEGKMHACGHDVHTTVLLGALNVLSKMPNLKRPVIGLFQPAEELGAGAKAVMKEGLLDGVSVALGIHVEPNLPLGTVSIKPGAMCACVLEFNIEFKGVSAHGARPHLGHDAILSACEFISQCYSMVPRTIDAREPHVLTFGAIHGGSRSNIISEACSLKATIRTFSTAMARKILEKVKRIAEGICIIHDTQYELEVVLDLPAVVTDENVAKDVSRGVASFIGAENVVGDFATSLGGEDFGVYLDQVKGGMFRLGIAIPGKATPALHSQNFDVSEKAIEIGVKAFVGATLELMGN